MKKRTVLIRTIVGLAVLAAGIIVQAENLFPAQDYGKLDPAGVPEGWQIRGKYEFKKLEDPESQPGFSVTSKEIGQIYVNSPKFAIAGGKTYVLTLKFRSNRFAETGYDKIGSFLNIKCLNAEGGDVLSNFSYQSNLQCQSPGQLDFPYTSVTSWKKRSISFVAPNGTVNASLLFTLNNEKANDALPEIQICNIAVQELSSSPAGDSILNMQAAQLNPGPAFDKAIDGKSALSKKDVKGNIGYGPYKEIPAGIYELCVRLKTSENSSDAPVFAVRAEGDPDGGELAIRGSDFKKSDEFQEFKFRFLKPSNAGLNLPCYKVAGCVITIDNITVSPVKQFNPQELNEYFLAK